MAKSCFRRPKYGTWVLLRIWLLLLIFVVVSCGDGMNKSKKMMIMLELLHRHSPKLIQLQEQQLLLQHQPDKILLHRTMGMLHSDLIRQQQVSFKLRSRTRRQHEYPIKVLGSEAESEHVRNKKNISVEIPMHSGADFGTAQYFVLFKAGTPAQKKMLIADTGSDLTWINCLYGCGGAAATGCSSRRMRRIFLADNSSSFKTIPCSSKMCKIDLANLFSLARCPSPLSPCAYDYRYSDGSGTLGFFANETVTVGLTNGRKMKLHNVLVGCSQSFRVQSFQGADGVMGLGYSNYSFAAKTAKKFGGKFSYCLVDHLSQKNISDYLIFGDHIGAVVVPNALQHTKLILGVLGSFYAVDLRGISLGGRMLNITVKIWDVNNAGGTILDSGTSLTVLPMPAYKPLMAALKASLKRLERLKLEIGPLKYCFNSSGFDEASSVPRLGFHFAGGAVLQPPVKSYVIDAAKGVKCLGFLPTSWPGISIIGNIMQQNHLWQFDLIKNELGFAPSTCTT